MAEKDNVESIEKELEALLSNGQDIVGGIKIGLETFPQDKETMAASGRSVYELQDEFTSIGKPAASMLQTNGAEIGRLMERYKSIAPVDKAQEERMEEFRRRFFDRLAEHNSSKIEATEMYEAVGQTVAKSLTELRSVRMGGSIHEERERVYGGHTGIKKGPPKSMG